MTILQQIAVFLWTGMNIYFFKYVVCHEEWFSIFGIVNFIVGSIGLIAFPFLANKFSRKVVYILSAVLLVLGLLGMFFTGSDENANIWLFFSMVGFFCLGNALAGVYDAVMLADTVEYGEYKSGIRSEAVVFSVQTFYREIWFGYCWFYRGDGFILGGLCAECGSDAGNGFGLESDDVYNVGFTDYGNFVSIS